MNIKLINLSITPYAVWYREITFERMGKVVKRKVKLKEPELHYDARYDLEVDDNFSLGSMYIDEHMQSFCCVHNSPFDEKRAILKSIKCPVSTDFLLIPTQLNEYSKPAKETV